MLRILLPLAIVASMYFTPMFSVETSDSLRGDSLQSVDGAYFVGNTVDCVIAMTPPIGEECASAGQLDESLTVGQTMSYSLLLALGAGALGVIGLLPFIGRITSVVTILAGLGALGSTGMLSLALMNSEAGLGAIGWGAYVTAGVGLLTVIAGLSGMRGR